MKQETEKCMGDEVLVYMNLMLRWASAAEVTVRRDDFRAWGKKIQLFEGVEEWFDRINEYGRTQHVNVKHYLVTSGNEEIFAGTAVSDKFAAVFASKFMFDEHDVANWPARSVNYTTKTQYLFRINKGALDLKDNKKINEFVEKSKRPVPFENMVYIGDGSTDIPCFRLVKEQGGLSVAVYKPHAKNARSKAQRYLDEGRVHCVVPAIYTEGGDLDCIIKANINAVASRATLSKLFAKKPRTTSQGEEDRNAGSDAFIPPIGDNQRCHRSPSPPPDEP